MAERQVSSSSISNGGSGRFTTPIDEEQGDIMFSMEGMEEDEKRSGEKRNSGGWTFAGGTRSPHLGAVGGGRNGIGGGGGEKNGNGVGMGVKGVEGMFGAR
jgi:hypothetical protein